LRPFDRGLGERRGKFQVAGDDGRPALGRAFGFAALTMIADLGLSATQYGFGAGLFFVTYFFFVTGMISRSIAYLISLALVLRLRGEEALEARQPAAV
jgi:hypothetical protein